MNCGCSRGGSETKTKTTKLNDDSSSCGCSDGSNSRGLAEKEKSVTYLEKHPNLTPQ